MVFRKIAKLIKDVSKNLKTKHPSMTIPEIISRNDSFNSKLLEKNEVFFTMNIECNNEDPRTYLNKNRQCVLTKMTLKKP